ncbi:hypothetical protein ACFL27_10715 [candidate division CSSED10-310 bacterium]|uniref:DUF2336 domain-containing protein n=1 Tax=candidate division CSSED10-310 bacterium TaxID=2855610 RepID=A0ABV6YWV6_UNCC1
MTPPETSGSDTPFGTVLQDIQEKTLDKEQRMIIAKGFLPLEPEVLAKALLYLSSDDEPEIKEAAQDTIMELPVAIVKNIAQSRDTVPELLHILARMRIGDSEILEAIILNPTINDDTFTFIAKHGPANVVEILSGNQERILQNEAIIAAILSNPNTSQFIRMRLEMYQQEQQEQREARERDRELAEQAAAQALEEKIKAERVKATPEPTTVQKESILKEKAVKPTVTKKAAPKKKKPAEKEEIELLDEEKEHITTAQRIAGMNVADRVKLATLGTREERMILVREMNRLVAVAAITSPKTTEDDVEQIAKLKNVMDDVLREIGTSREYTKSPTIRRALIENPRTPVGITLNLMKHANEKELWELSRNRNIPDVIRTTARRAYSRKMKRKSGGGGH